MKFIIPETLKNSLSKGIFINLRFLFNPKDLLSSLSFGRLRNFRKLFIAIGTAPVLMLLPLIPLAHSGAPANYDCTSPSPEDVGFHNMVLFGLPDKELFVYHLPIFAGNQNGTSGHVLKHVYQALWNVDLDESTSISYASKFRKMQSSDVDFPFFSLSPQGRAFKVPEMICDVDFTTSVSAVYGHVEGNLDFPAPEALIDGLSQLTVYSPSLLAHRFNQMALSELTYVLFGNPSQYYLAHYITGAENSFDQIVAIELKSESLKNELLNQKSLMVIFEKEKNPKLLPLDFSHQRKSLNNKFRLAVGAEYQIRVDKHTSQIEVTASVYFNQNEDLRTNPPLM